jgi:hypothetical protein
MSLAKLHISVCKSADILVSILINSALMSGVGLYSALTLSLTDCNEVWDQVNWETGQVDGSDPYSNQQYCDSLAVSIGLGCAHAALLVLWLVGLLGAAIFTGLKSRGGPGVGRTLQVSAGWLLSGWPISVAEKAKPR